MGPCSSFRDRAFYASIDNPDDRKAVYLILVQVARQHSDLCCWIVHLPQEIYLFVHLSKVQVSLVD